MYYLILFDFRAFNLDKEPHKQWAEDGKGIFEHPIYKKIKSLASNHESFGDGDNFAYYDGSCFPTMVLLYNNELTAKEIYNELTPYIVEGTDVIRGDELYVIEINPNNSEGYGPVAFSWMLGKAEHIIKKNE